MPLSRATRTAAIVAIPTPRGHTLKPVAYVQGYSSSVTSKPDAEPDTIFIDVGEHEIIAMIQTRMPLEAETCLLPSTFTASC